MSIVRRFKLAVDDFDVDHIGTLGSCHIEVVIYDTTEEMQDAMVRYGLPAHLARNSGGGFGHRIGKPYRGYLGIMRLALDTHLESVIIHECLHVAVRAAKWHYGVEELRLNEAKNGEREEVVAYYMQAFGWCLFNEVRRMGVIEEVA
ncbi:hypothetical protein SEA_ODAY_107 [Gordonia phage ODay]|nr:hypothetical protein SEA_ODAY_107 [Gordonia phage ODay]